MIKKAIEKTATNGLLVSISGIATGSKIIGAEKIKTGKAGATTISRKQIVEVDDGVLPNDCDMEQARNILTDYILEGPATVDEISALVALYPPYEVGKAYAIRYIFSYDGKLYKVNQAHESAEQWVPGEDGTEALYTEIAPAGVIPLWVQPTGAHDAYAIGDRVQWPEGTVWESTITANTTEPGTLLEWGYWVEVTA